MIQGMRSRLPQSPHLGSISKLVSGAALAQVIGVAVTPIITRLYDPGAYGSMAIFNAIAAIVASVAALRYDSALTLPTETPQGERQALALTKLALLSATLIGLITLLVILTITTFWPTQALTQLGPWAYGIPVAVVFTSWTLTLTGYATRDRAYSRIAGVAPMQRVVGASMQIGFGLLRWGQAGLLLATMITPAVGMGVLHRTYRQGRNRVLGDARVAWAQMWSVAKRYKDFPLVSSWFALLNAAAWNIQALVIAHYYPVAQVGQYALAFSVISLPAGLFLQGISPVYLKECAARAHDTHASLRLINQTLRWTLVVSVPLFIGLALISTQLFTVLFGEQWREAGYVALAMIPLVWARFLTTSLTVTFNVYRRQAILLVWQVVALALTLGGFIWGSTQGMSVTQVTLQVSLVVAPAYLCLIPLVRWTVKQGPPAQVAEEALG